MFGKKKIVKQKHRVDMIEMYESSAYEERCDGMTFMPKVLDY